MLSVRNALLSGILAAVFFPAGAGASQPVVRPDPPANPEDLVPCTTDGQPTAYLPRLLRVNVNGSQIREEFIFLQRPCGALLARSEDLNRMRIRTAGKPAVLINGEPYLNLNRYEKMTYVLDPFGQALAIEGEPEIFFPTVIDFTPPPSPPPQASGPGAFLNYGGFLAGPLQEGERTLSANAGLGVFGEAGVVTSDWLAFHRSDDSSVNRAGTTYTYDFVEHITSVRAGDLAARGGSFGSGVSIGGLQYGTNFATRPRMRTTPVLMMDAATSRWSAVGLFNDDILNPDRGPRAAFMNNLATVSYGPVELVNMPTYNNGEYELVLRDSLGGETTVRQAYFFNQGLLREGLHDFSVEAGVLRQGVIGNDYDGAFGAGTYRRGLTNTFTAEAHAEGSDFGEAAGGSASWAAPYLGVLTGTAAGSHHDLADGTGTYGALSLENRYRSFAYAMRGECQSDNFLLASVRALPTVSNACRSLGSVSATLPNHDTLGVSASTQTFRGQEPIQRYEAQYGTLPFTGAQLLMFAGWSNAGAGGYTVGLSFSCSFAGLARAPPTGEESLLDPRRATMTVTAVANENGEESAFAQLTNRARVGGGDISVQAASSIVGAARQNLSAGWTSPRLLASAGVFRAEESKFFNAGASSAFIWLDEGIFQSSPLHNGFAVVRLGETNGGVRVNGARTDDEGDVVLTPLIPYYPNVVSVNPSDLPLDARLDQVQFEAIPRYRSGVVVRPGIARVRGAILKVRVRDEAGREQPLPLGAVAIVDGQPEPFPVGEDGEVYVEGLERATTVTLRYNLQECRISVTPPAKPPADGMPELGPYLCDSIRP